MMFFVGLIVVLTTVIGSYSIHGDLGILWQPIEFVIIFGGATGALLISAPMHVVKAVLKGMGMSITGAKYKNEHYLELLGVLFAVFKLAKSKGDLALESHIENPMESSLFAEYPLFQANHHALDFFCDYLRLLTMGANNPFEVEAVMDVELDLHHDHDHLVAGTLGMVGESFPALGIVAAVMGVIVTMGSITEPPEILGGLIGAALVGTFFGILMAYGLVSPMAKALDIALTSDAQYLNCIKSGILGHMQGYAPQISVEFARKSLDSKVRPSFAELEDMLSNVPAPEAG